MNSIPIYQHPFVDVFKATKLNEWQLGHKEGDVTEVYDKELAKNVIKINGVTTASNYIQLPASKHLPKKALGLTGKYVTILFIICQVYLTINVPAGKSFVVHLDYTVNETRLVRVSLSNIYKEFKNLNGNSIQVPASLPYAKWTMIALNLYQILQDCQVFIAGQNHAFSMRSMQITANLQIKGLFTSDMKYTVATLPKEMAMKNTKSKEWFEQYAWIDYPSDQVQPDQLPEENKENKQLNQEKNTTRPKSNIRKSTSQTKGKSVKFTQETKKSSQLNKDLEEEKVLSDSNQEYDLQREEGFDQYKEEIKESVMNAEEVIRGKDAIEKTMTQIDQLKSQMNFNLEQKNINSNAQITLYQQEAKMPMGTLSRTIIQNQDEKFVLKPNPIMKLDRVIGMHPRFSSGKIFYNKDAKLSKELLYTQANLFLGYYPPQQRQRLFYDHQTAVIEHLYVCQTYAFTASKSTAKEDSKDYELSIWDTQDQTCIFTFKPPLLSINAISLSSDMQQLSISGKDFQKRDLILVYVFSDLVKYKKIELYARQLSDFDIVNMRFNDVQANSLISCGKENIRFYKIKNNHLPGQSVALNNTGRGKIFNNTVVDYTINEKNQKKPSFVYVTTECGLLYFANFNTRQIDKIIQIHEDKITSLKLSPERNFCVTTSINGILRLWSPDFSKLISEVNTQQQILDCDISLTQKEITVLSAQGSISILDLELSSYNVLMRSHLENITDLCYNQQSQKLITVGLDQCIKIWNAETMELENEFTTQNDQPIKASSNPSDSTVAIGFKSGFVRIFDVQQNKMVAETMIYESPVMDLQYSQDNKFLGIFYKSSQIVIFNVEKGYQPIKTIDYDFPNDNYFSLCFSPDGKYMANVSSNANNVTVWETKNFSLKFHLDLTGEIIQKIRFAPNSKDFIVLTTSSKLKFYRVGLSELQYIKEAYGVTDMECLDFEISANNKFIFVAGREGVIKVFDYFLRGEIIASTQAFLGHFKYPLRVVPQDDLRFVYSIGEGNGVYRWQFNGDREMPTEIFKHYEQIQEKEVKDIKKTHNSSKQLTAQQNQEPTFDDDELERLGATQILSYQEQLNNLNNEENQLSQQPFEYDTRPTKQNSKPLISLTHESLIQYNKSGYRFEQFDIELKKVLSCSTDEGISNNLVWNKEQRYIAYTSQNVVIVEDINQEKTQRLLKEGNDKIYQVKLSPNGRLLLAFNREGKIDGFPCIYIWDAATLKKLNQIAINDSEISAVEFSQHSNMLLVISKSYNNTVDSSDVVSCISVWDFLEGHKDILCKSHLPMNVIDGRWNYYLGDSTEFVTISERKYHYWKITNTLNLQYQEGDIPKAKNLFGSKEDKFTSLEFVVPTAEQISTYLLIGLNNGYVWVSDARANQYLYNVKAIDSSIRYITTTHSKIIVEGLKDTIVHCWPQGQGDFDKSDPQSFFLGKEISLTLDGFPKACSYDEAGNECMMSTSSGTIWFMSWSELQTVKLKSCHNPAYPIKSIDYKYIPPAQFQIYQEQNEFYQFDQNYMIASSGQDGIIKLWNMFDIEFQLQFIVPKEECVAIAMHQFKPYMIGSFTDGYLRFFEVNKSKNLGRCLIYSDQERSITDHLISIKILPSGNHVLGASKNGQVILIFVQQWDPLAIKIEQIASINTSIHSFDVSHLEPYNKWLVGTGNGKIITYNRKDFNAFQQEIFDEENPPKFNFMDSFNVLDYVDNGFTESKRSNTLDHYYSVSKRNLVYNEVINENLCEALFSNLDLTLQIGFIRKCNYIFLRNFELHQIVKRIELTSLPLQLGITPNSPFFIVLQAGKHDNFNITDSTVKMIDLVNEKNTSEVKTMHEEAKIMKICPNGKYIITGGDKGDICIWNIKRKDMPLPE